MRDGTTIIGAPTNAYDVVIACIVGGVILVAIIITVYLIIRYNN